MMKLKALAMAAFLAAPLAASAAFTAEEVFEKMIDVDSRREALTADVSRIEKHKIGPQAGKTIKVKGDLAVRKGGYARLIIEKPAPQKVVTNGKVMWMEMTNNSMVYKMPTKEMKKSGNFFLDLGGTIRFYAKNSVKRLAKVGKGYDSKKVAALELDPKDSSKAGFDLMRVWIDTDRWVILKAVLKSEAADVEVVFDKVKTYGLRSVKDDGYKLKLWKRFFRYSPPEDFEVFDLEF